MSSYVNIPGYSKYVINQNYPHQVMRIKGSYIVAETPDKDGYMHIKLVNDEGKRKTLCKHRLVALMFVHNPDPEHFIEIDHINHEPSDNHISNLRWTDRATNCRNRGTIRGITYEFVTELPQGSVKVDHYNKHQFNDIYFNADANTFYKKVADHYFRVMHERSVSGGNQFIQTLTAVGKQTSVFNHVVAREIDMYSPVDIEGNLIPEPVAEEQLDESTEDEFEESEVESESIDDEEVIDLD